LPGAVTPLEEIGFGHRQTSEEDSGSGQSTIIDTRHPFFATQPDLFLASTEIAAQNGDDAPVLDLLDNFF
jgi:hypothetical protein